MEAMSKKEKLARGSAVIKVMRVNPRPGHFLKSYVDPRRLPRTLPPGGTPKGILAEMPWLDVKNAKYSFTPLSAKVKGRLIATSGDTDCNIIQESAYRDPKTIGLADDDKMMGMCGYREWMEGVNPLFEGNIAEHFNVMLGLLISMAQDPENSNFADIEAYPCVQFLKTVTTEDGSIPFNVARFVSYIEFVCQKMIDEG